MKSMRLRTMLLFMLLVVAGIVGLQRSARRAAAPARTAAASAAFPAQNFSRKGVVYQQLDAKPAAESDYDLAADEAKGGHTLARHVGKSDDELRARLAAEPDISAASSWTDRDAAETAVMLALERNQEKIERWRAREGRRPNLPVEYHGLVVIGRSLRRGDATARDCRDALVVLKADGADYFVLTAYPEAGR
jgi:hypothetical protein